MANQPSMLWLLRHGQSLGNVAREAPRTPGTLMLDIADRDMDVPLSDLGRRQARAFGEWMGAQPTEEQPEVVISSPYVRAVQTAQTALEAAGMELRVHLDERLRERELGILDLYTWEGVKAQFPDEARRRERLGKFYHRPPGGESWVDVALRLRSLKDSMSIEHDGRRVLIVTHEVVIVMIRYLYEELDEKTALGLSTAQRLANCSLTSYITGRDGVLELDRDAWTTPLEEAAAPVTKAHDAPVAPR